MHEYVQTEINKTCEMLNAVKIDKLLINKIISISGMISDALRNNKKILLAGNGGSAADSQHIAAEFVSRLNFDRPALSAIALTTDTSALTAIGNDYGFDKLFERQIEAIASEGDIFISLSTSGKSQNVLNAMVAASKLGVRNVSISGGDGGSMKDHSDELLLAPSTETAKIQEFTIVVAHIMCSIVERELFHTLKVS